MATGRDTRNSQETIMRNNALYFPYIEVPDETWTTRVLLYWDKLSSIVPMDYIVNPGLLSPHMRDLVHEGLVHQVSPANYIYRFQGYEENFINYLARRLPRMRPQHGRVKTRIHIEKLGELPRWLLAHGLAEPADYPWYEVEGWVANAYMAYLASTLGSIDEIDSAPVTDNVGMSRFFGAFSRNSGIEREELLKTLLPVPAEKVPLDSLIRFKEKYGHLLPPLREKIELLSMELGAIQDLRQRLARAKSVAHEWNEQIREIEAAMEFNWKHIISVNFLPLLGAGGSFYATDPAQQLVAAGSAGISFAGTAYHTINSLHENNRRINNKPLAYLALARRHIQRRA